MSRNSYHGIVRPAQVEDLETIRKILQAWISDGADIEHTIQAISDSLGRPTGNGAHYFVAQTPASLIAGVMGMTGENINAELYSSDDKPVEFVSAYVAPSERGTGAGRALADHLERLAATQGYTKLIIVSGSRNRDSGYPFWMKRYGEPALTDHNFYGQGQERVIWTKNLAT